MVEDSVDEALVERFLRRFEGYDKAYGGYDPKRTVVDILDGKVEIKGTAFTRKKPVTLELIAEHLNGKKPLGIIPIRENNTCRWGVIDIDDYQTDIPELQRRIIKEELPLIICQSKSGGAHLFLFMTAPVAAALMQICLKQVAASLGHGQVEVFPKQRRVEWNKGDLGGWLNMPYFGDTRQAYDPQTGEFLTLEQFLDLADKYAQNPDWLEVDFVKQQNENVRRSSGDIKGDSEFSDGPPCLQYLSSIGLGEGNRNNGILAYGVFAKKKYSTTWKDMLDQWNRAYCKPPLSTDEMTGIMKRLDKKDFYYRCKDQPLVSHCNSALCRVRKYGVASDNTSRMPVISGLSVMLSDPPLFFVDVGDQRLELTVEHLMNYNEFRRVCLGRSLKFYNPMKQDAWAAILQDLLDNVTIIDISPEVGIFGQFTELLADFVKDTNRADQKDDILMGNPWFDDSDEDPAEHKHYFRLKDFRKFLMDANFKHYSDSLIAAKIRGLGGDNIQLRLKGEPRWVWHVPVGFSQGHVRGEPVPPEGSPI